MNLQFANPEILFLLWLVPGIGLWWHFINRQRRTRLELFMSPDMQKKLLPDSGSRKLTWQSALVLTGIFAALISAARPQWGMKDEIVYSRGRDLIIALDVSRSMLANDVHPNRLERAKTDIIDLIKELKGDRAALLSFRYKASLLCPLTTDYAYLKYALNAVNIDSAPPGETDIGNAINKALDSFENNNGAHKAIILISDGEDLSGNAIDAAKTAAERKIPIFTVGLGSRQGSRIPNPDKTTAFVATGNGSDVVTKLNHETLYNIAKITGGAYIPVETSSMASITLGNLYRNHLRNIQAQDMEESLQRRYIERYQLFLLPGVLLLLAGSFFSRGRLSTSTTPPAKPSAAKTTPVKDLTPPKRKLKYITIIAALTGCFISTRLEADQTPPASSNSITQVKQETPAVNTNRLSTPPGREGARFAQKLYMLGKYEEAANAYLNAAEGSTRKSQLDYRHNAAVALFKAGKHKEAAEIFKQLDDLSENENRFAPSMALGSSLYRAAELANKQDLTNVTERAQLLKEAGEAFKNAARTETGNESARENLAVVLKNLPEAESQAHIMNLMSKYEQTPPANIAMEMLTTQSEINRDLLNAITNKSPSRIKQMEDLALKQKRVSDLWIPLKPKLMAGTTEQDQQKLANLDQTIELTRDNMITASKRLRDLDQNAGASASQSRAVVYQIWKSIAPSNQILQQDIKMQSNSISQVESKTPNQPLAEVGQNESVDLTKIFIQCFSDAVPDQTTGSTSQAVMSLPVSQLPTAEENSSATNQISPEKRQKILDLAKQAVFTQEMALGLLKQKNFQEALPQQKVSYELLKEIEKLLPKDENQQQQQQKQEQQKDQEQQQQKQQNQQQQNDKQENKKPQPQEDEKKDDKENIPEDVQKMLEKALQREQEHEAEKQKNMQIPMSPSERDW